MLNIIKERTPITTMPDIHVIAQILESSGHKVDITTTKDKDIMLQTDNRFGEKVTMIFDGKGKGNFLYFL